jgi:hypothetical protein
MFATKSVRRWMRRWRTRLTGGQAAAAAPPLVVTIDRAQKGRAEAGEYRLLHKYLRDRYANRVVLTFTEIEDLLGFALPEPARLQREWWSVAGPLAQPSAQSDAWTLASRTATVNLAAKNVVFEREIPTQQPCAV